MPKFCRAFQPRTRPQQLQAIGLCGGNAPSQALCRCLDPTRGDWEDIEPPERGEWLESMLERTPDQSFAQFSDARPNVPDRSRHTIYLQPLCAAEDLQAAPFPEGPWPSWAFLEAAVRRFYGPVDVAVLPPRAMASLCPRPASRQNEFGLQWHAGEVLDALAKLQAPKDAFCTLAVTMCDLYPRESWNFVYGLARLAGRVGVFSFVRHAPSAAGTAEWRQAELLYHSTKTMLHEIGHMFGMKHCTWYNCLMRGNNGREVEHQENPLLLCPVCLRKLLSSIGFDVPAHYAGLLDLFQTYEGTHRQWHKDCEFLRRRLQALKDVPEGATTSTSVGRDAQGGLRSRSSPAPHASAPGAQPSSRASPAERRRTAGVATPQKAMPRTGVAAPQKARPSSASQAGRSSRASQAAAAAGAGAGVGGPVRAAGRAITVGSGTRA